jgi:hypothetical protein
VATLRDRAPETWATWLGEEPADIDRLKVLLAPHPAEEMTMWPVDKRDCRLFQGSGLPCRICGALGVCEQHAAWPEGFLQVRDDEPAARVPARPHKTR